MPTISKINSRSEIKTRKTPNGEREEESVIGKYFNGVLVGKTQETQ